MGIFRDIDLIIYAQFLLIYIIASIRRFNKRNDISSNLFRFVAYSLSIVNILEGVTWALNGTSLMWGHQISVITNSVLLLCNALPAVAWVSYVDYKIFGDTGKLKRRFKWYMTPIYISAILIIINIWTGFVFTIDKNNVYSRGPGVIIIGLMTYIMVIGLFIKALRYKEQINSRVLQSIFIFMLFPLVAGIVQMFIYGMLLVWPALVLATLIAFLQVERDSMQRDPLTGLVTRQRMEHRANLLINRKTGFSIILVDMDDFKNINDCFGHHEGDRALIIMSSILRRNVKACDLICRYGGDEFVILLETDDEAVVSRINDRISTELNDFNCKKIKKYDLCISTGYAICDSGDCCLDEILAKADFRMYQDKEKKRGRAVG